MEDKDVAFESTDIDETIAHFEKQDENRKNKERRKRITEEERCERSIHRFGTSTTKGYSRKYSDKYDSIDWSK